jgi:hypothetical protein
MEHHHLLAILGSLCVCLACTERDGDPSPCSDAGQTLEDGEERESPDGCVTYVCADGILETADDRRNTVAGDLELASQQAVDQQSCLGVVEGTLRITGTAATLRPLASLYRIGTGLEIVGSDAVTLGGLEGLTEVGGDIGIVDNARLTTLSFQPTMSAFGAIAIQNNDALVSLAGAEFIGQCASCVAVSGRPTELADRIDAQDEPAGFADEAPAGGTFYGNILVADNDGLADVLAIANLYSAWSDVRFRSNPALNSLGGLQLMEVRGDLEIRDHAAMSTADAETFAAGVAVVGTTTICGNLDGMACP